MRVLCRAYDLDELGDSGRTLRAVEQYLRRQGDEVWATADAHDVSEVCAWRPDLIVSQQWATGEASRWATTLRVPFVMVVHGQGQYEHFRPQCDLIVFTSQEQHDLARKAIGRTPWMVLRLATAGGPDSELPALRQRLAHIAVMGRRRPTITLCMTVANEAGTLEHAIASVAQVVDEIVIGVDVKSTDATADLASRYATRSFTFDESRPPDFPRMRNRAMELVETDWVIVVDGHEWVEHADAIPEALETTAWSIEIETLFEPDEQRIPGLAFPFPRIHRRHVRFAGAPAHEEVDTPGEHRHHRPDIKVWHERKPGEAARVRHAEKSGAELESLKTAWEIGGDRRALFYLANGLREAARHDEAVDAYEEYLRAPNFDEEAWQARLYVARCHVARQDWSAARHALEDAILAGPERAEALVDLGHVLLAAGEPRRAAAWFRMATALPRPSQCRMFVEVPVYRWGAWHGLALALDGMGEYAAAADAELHALDGGAGPWATENVRWWRARAEEHP
jgi:glycosyltransferase involved in cell wall biosynthesis